MRLLSAVLLAVVTSQAALGQTYTISTFAGGGLPVNIPGTSASLYGPAAVAVDRAGNVFFAGLHVVLRSDATTGILTAVAGNGTGGFSGDDGPATSAQLFYPSGVALDSAGNIYIADTLNDRIRKVSNGVITTVAGGGTSFGDNGPATSAQLIHPYSVAVDSVGNIYIGDNGNARIRKVSNGVITTVAGNGTSGFSGDSGPATSAQLNLSIMGAVLVDSVGNLYIADTGNGRIRKVSNGVITTVAGNGTLGFSGDNGPATSAQLAYPWGLAMDSTGNLYVADWGNDGVRKVSNGVITSVAGNGTHGFSGDNGPANSAQLYDPQGVAVDSAGNLYITDTANYRIRKVSNGVITTVAGNGTPVSGDNGPASSAQLDPPIGVAVDSAGNLYVADNNSQRIRKVSNGVITAVAGNGTRGFSGDNGPATSAQLNNPQGVAVDSAGNLYIADWGNARIRKVSNGAITTVAGNGTQGFSGDNGPATSAQLNYPQGVAVDSAGNLYVADIGNARVRKVSNGVITTVAGNGTSGFSGDNGPATSAEFFNTTSVAVDSAGSLYIADSLNSRIRKVSNGVITTVAGSGPSYPVNSSGGGFSGDNGPATSAQIRQPYGVAEGPAGDIYIADTDNFRIRLLTPGTAPTITRNGIVPVYSSVPVIQPGSWVSIYGSDLASGTFLWNDNFPTSLGGTSATIDNKPVYLWSVSPTQINLQVPDDTTTGLVSVAVTTGSGTSASTVTLSPYGPSFSVLGDGKHVAGEIATPNGNGAYGGGAYDLVGPSNTFSYNTRPVKVGETLQLYGVGFGPTTPQVLSGQAFAGAAPTNSPVTVTIGGLPASVSFAGLIEAGLYQINVTIPANAGSGDQPLQATVNGVQTPLGPVVTVQ